MNILIANNLGLGVGGNEKGDIIALKWLIHLGLNLCFGSGMANKINREVIARHRVLFHDCHC